MPSSEPVFRGVGVALVTLFDAEGTPDMAATAAHAARVVERGVRAVLLAGTTGEFWALSETDRVELIRAVRAALPSEVPVLAGTGADDTATAVRLTSAAVTAGADAVLVLSPRGATDLRDYYNAVAEAAADRPVLGYHMPVISSPGLPLDQLATLPIQGIKDSSLDPAGCWQNWISLISTSSPAWTACCRTRARWAVLVHCRRWPMSSPSCA